MSLEDFESFIRIHLSRQIQASVAGQKSRSESSIVLATKPTPEDDGDAGLIDLLDLADQYFGDLAQILERMTADSTAFGASIVERSAEMTTTAERAGGNMDRQLARILIERAADVMNRYIARTRSELPLFRESLSKGINTAARLGLLAAEQDQADRTAAFATKNGMTQLAEILGGARESIAGFRSTAHSLPRLTSVLNRAKRDTSDVLDEIMDAMAEGRSLLLEAAKSVEALLGQEGAANPRAGGLMTESAGSSTS